MTEEFEAAGTSKDELVAVWLGPLATGALVFAPLILWELYGVSVGTGGTADAEVDVAPPPSGNLTGELGLEFPTI